jgi:hypothetical protein
MKEFDITGKLTKEEIEQLIEKIKSGNKIEVYRKFNCRHLDQERVHSIYCDKCQYLYKIDIREPGVFGCYVEDFIRRFEKQFENLKETNSVSTF